MIELVGEIRRQVKHIVALARRSLLLKHLTGRHTWRNE